MLLGTHLVFKDSQQKQMDDPLVRFAATVVESKLSIDCMYFLISFQELICTGKQNERSLFGKSFVFITYKYEWSIVDNEIYLRNENEVSLGISIFWHNQQAALRVFIRNTFLAVRYNIWRSIKISPLFWHIWNLWEVSRQFGYSHLTKGLKLETLAFFSLTVERKDLSIRLNAKHKNKCIATQTRLNSWSTDHH